MKNFVLAIIFLVMLSIVHGQEIDKHQLNLESHNFLAQVQSALGKLSNTMPLLKGIDQVPISDVAPSNSAQFVSERLVFAKNVHIEKDPRPASGPPPASEQWQVVDLNGIILEIGITDHIPKIETSKVVPITKGPHNVNLYYLIKTHEKDDPQIAVIKAVIDPMIDAFIKALK